MTKKNGVNQSYNGVVSSIGGFPCYLFGCYRNNSCLNPLIHNRMTDPRDGSERLGTIQKSLCKLNLLKSAMRYADHCGFQWNLIFPAEMSLVALGKLTEAFMAASKRTLIQNSPCQINMAVSKILAFFGL